MSSKYFYEVVLQVHQHRLWLRGNYGHCLQGRKIPVQITIKVKCIQKGRTDVSTGIILPELLYFVETITNIQSPDKSNGTNISYPMRF